MSGVVGGHNNIREAVSPLVTAEPKGRDMDGGKRGACGYSSCVKNYRTEMDV